MLPFKYFQVIINNILELVFKIAKYRSTYRKHTYLSWHLPCRPAVLRDGTLPTSCPCAGNSLPFAQSGIMQVENSHGHTSLLCTSAPLRTCGRAGSAICLAFIWVIYSSEVVVMHSFIHLLVLVKSGLRKIK